jgi:hypothetical protein
MVFQTNLRSIIRSTTTITCINIRYKICIYSIQLKKTTYYHKNDWSQHKHGQYNSNIPVCVQTCLKGFIFFQKKTVYLYSYCISLYYGVPSTWMLQSTHKQYIIIVWCSINVDVTIHTQTIYLYSMVFHQRGCYNPHTNNISL